jgi:hypothetical protein
MENAPAIQLSSSSPTPGADISVYERMRKWSDDVYFPMRTKTPEVQGIDNYQIIRETPEYGSRVNIRHYKNLQDWKDATSSSETKAIVGEMESWRKRGINDMIWTGAYTLIKSFRNIPIYTTDNLDTRIQNAPILNLEGYRMTSTEWEKYLQWFSDFGYSVFMPLFLRLPGLVGYDWYKDTGLRFGLHEEEGWEYPKYLSMVYFENIKAFENYAISPELAGFQKSIRSIIPRRLGYSCYVQYQLVKSWRK